MATISKLQNTYQTIPLPDGKRIEGAFPTIKWFNSIPVSWKNKTVLDVGCCNFSYGIQALQAGASHITGIDIEPKKIEQCEETIGIWDVQDRTKVICSSAEDYSIAPHSYNIVLMSMVLHWIKQPKLNLLKFYKYANSNFVLIYRLLKAGVGWRPTLDELYEVLGVEPSYHTVLENTDTQYIGLTVYDKNI